MMVTTAKTCLRLTAALAALLCLTADHILFSGLGAGLLWSLIATDEHQHHQES